MSSPQTNNPGMLASIGAALRQNRTPCLLLNAVVITLVVSYYYWPAAAGVWKTLADLKTRGSFAFSLVSTMFAAALLPYAIQAAMGTLPPGRRWRRLGLLMLFWGYRGMEIDLFYRFQGMLFGHGNDPGTLLKKVAMDQLVYSTIWAVPSYIIALRWIDDGRSWRRMLASLDRRFWRRTYPTILLTNWLIWMPALALVYSLPPALQFPLFAVIMCFFVLLATLLAREAPAAQTTTLATQ